MRQIRPVLEKQLTAVEAQAQTQVELLRNTALQNMTGLLGAEKARLVYLRSVNPSIRAEEITALESRIAESESALAMALATSQALRIIIAT